MALLVRVVWFINITSFLITHSIAENETSYKFIFKIPERYDMINLNNCKTLSGYQAVIIYK